MSRSARERQTAVAFLRSVVGGFHRACDAARAARPDVPRALAESGLWATIVPGATAVRLYTAHGRRMGGGDDANIAARLNHLVASVTRPAPGGRRPSASATAAAEAVQDSAAVVLAPAEVPGVFLQ